jgi:hypothetical protein
MLILLLLRLINVFFQRIQIFLPDFLKFQNQPLTGLGHLIHNEKDSRRRPVHSKSDISQVTFMAVILKVFFQPKIIFSV